MFQYTYSCIFSNIRQIKINQNSSSVDGDIGEHSLHNQIDDIEFS